jgi:DNA polymerase III delta subunit
MANYNQWRSKHPENKLLYYVCGAELSLSLEVRDAVIQQWTHPPNNAILQYVDVAKSSFASVENIVLMQPNSMRVVLLENVDKLQGNQRACVEHYAWLITQGRLTYTALVCFTREQNPDTADPFYRPFVEKGRFVECKTMSVDNMKKYAMDDYNCTEEAANVLAEMVSYSFLKFNNELEKLSCLDLPRIEATHIRDLVVFSAEDLFMNYMLVRNNPQALKVVSAVHESTVAQIMTNLVKKLAFLYLMIKEDTPGIGAHKLAAILGVQPWQLLEYFAIKKFWNGPLILEKIRLITQIESHYSKYSTNILPLLVAWW